MMVLIVVGSELTIPAITSKECGRYVGYCLHGTKTHHVTRHVVAFYFGIALYNCYYEKCNTVNYFLVVTKSGCGFNGHTGSNLLPKAL